MSSASEVTCPAICVVNFSLPNSATTAPNWIASDHSGASGGSFASSSNQRWNRGDMKKKPSSPSDGIGTTPEASQNISSTSFLSASACSSASRLPCASHSS